MRTEERGSRTTPDSFLFDGKPDSRFRRNDEIGAFLKDSLRYKSAGSKDRARINASLRSVSRWSLGFTASRALAPYNDFALARTDIKSILAKAQNMILSSLTSNPVSPIQIKKPPGH